MNATSLFVLAHVCTHGDEEKWIEEFFEVFTVKWYQNVQKINKILNFVQNISKMENLLYIIEILTKCIFEFWKFQSSAWTNVDLKKCEKRSKERE